MPQLRLVFITTTVGVLLIVFSWVWPAITGGRHAWSESDAEQLQATGVQFHQLKYQYQAALLEASKKPTTGNAIEHSGIDSPENNNRYAKAKDIVDRYAQVEERYRGLNAKLEQAKSGGQSAAKAMQWIGIGVILVGILGYFSMRTHSGS